MHLVRMLADDRKIDALGRWCFLPRRVGRSGLEKALVSISTSAGTRKPS